MIVAFYIICWGWLFIMNLWFISWSVSKASVENCTNAQIGPLVVNSNVDVALKCIEGKWGNVSSANSSTISTQIHKKSVQYIINYSEWQWAQILLQYRGNYWYVIRASLQVEILTTCVREIIYHSLLEYYMGPNIVSHTNTLHGM